MATKKLKKCCANCHFGEFERTQTGRVRKTGYSGTCELDTDDLRHRICKLIQAYPTWVQLGVLQNINLNRNAIWPEDGTECPSFKPKQEEA